MTLTETRRWLESRGIQLTKSLGQNFLHDGNQLRRIVAAAELAPTDRVLEVGPGLGPLTQLLLEQAAEVLAVEMDPRLLEVLRERFAAKDATGTPALNHRLTLVHADALQWLRRNPRDWSAWKLVANLPYSVGSPVLVELAEAEGPPQRIVTTLQLEVVRRLAAKTGSDDYGILTLLLQLRYRVADWFKISAGCFFPEPNVDSACITLVRHPAPLLSPAEAKTFTQLVKLAFGQRRKMMLKRLKTQWPEALLTGAFAELGIPLTERAEQVSLEQFAGLARRLHGRAGAD